MNNRQSINIVLLGPVSAGKSTLTNMLFVEQLSDIKIKRTTALPQIYHEVYDNKKINNLKQIKENNRQINQEFMKKTEGEYKLQYSDVKEFEYIIPPIFDLVKLQKDVFLSVYDTPGLNDSRTKNVYYEYIQKNFHKFDIVMFVLDINSAMNTSDESDILNLILTQIKNNKNNYDIDTNLIVLMNKCDEMELNKKENKYMPHDEELLEMYYQADTIIKTHIQEIYPEAKYYILPISCEDTYIYRMYKKNPKSQLDTKHLNKFGANEYGKTRWNILSEKKKKTQIVKLFKKFDYNERIKMSGFQSLKDTMSQILNEQNQYIYLINHIKYDLSQITDYKKNDINGELDKFYICQQKINNLTEQFKKNKNFNRDLVTNALNDFMKNYQESQVDQYVISTPDINTYPTYIQFDEIYKKITNIFKIKQPTFIVDTHNKLLNNIILYHVECINDPECTLETMMSLFEKLFNNGYCNLNELIINTLSNVSKYNSIHTNIINSLDIESSTIVDILNTIEKKYNFGHNIITDLGLTMLYKSYKLINFNTQEYDRLPEDGDHLFSLIFYGFCDQILIKHTNPYFWKIKQLKNICSTIYDIKEKPMLELKTSLYDIPLLNYIFERIKTAYPFDILYTDDMINNFFEKQDNKIENKKVQLIDIESDSANIFDEISDENSSDAELSDELNAELEDAYDNDDEDDDNFNINIKKKEKIN